jgi:pimeloyl-ACP methyl ester carboxylesterase
MRAFVVMVLAVSLLGPAAPATAGRAACTLHSRGRLVAVEPLVQLAADAVAAEIRVSARFGVSAYRVTYCTVDATVASGLMVLPQGLRGPLPLVMYEHGTTIGRTEVPSFLTPLEGRIIPFFFASDGFAVVAPDYPGLGVSPGRHPYGHAASEAAASLDLLPAAFLSAARQGVAVSRRVLLTGFSQGGQAAMATGQALQGRQSGWRLGALASIAGPFDLLGGVPLLLDPERSDPAKATVYLAYLLTAWKDLYRLYDDPAQVFHQPYAGIVEGLFDGSHGTAEVIAALPSTPGELLLPQMLEQIARPTGRLAEALRANETCDWAPAVPARLYAGRLDRDVVFAHAEFCRRQILAAGGQAEVVDLGDVDHLTTALLALPQIRDWFRYLARWQDGHQ